MTRVAKERRLRRRARLARGRERRAKWWADTRLPPDERRELNGLFDRPALSDFETMTLEEIEKLPASIRGLVKASRGAAQLSKLDWITADLTTEISETCFDKSDWGPGPWQTEPDLLMWRAQTPPNYRCQITRNQFGSLCGYVAIPEGHPAHGKDSGDDGVEELEAHGGLTFAGPATGGHWVLGFDCAHGFDIQPAMDARIRRLGMRPVHEEMSFMGADTPPAFIDRYRDVAYVRREVEFLAAQLAAVALAGKLPEPTTYDEPAIDAEAVPAPEHPELPAGEREP